MIKYAVHNKRNIQFYKNESHRVRVKCVDGCPFLMHCSWDDNFKCFQLKTLKPEHMCNCQYKLKVVSQIWLEERFEEKIIDDIIINFNKHIQSELKISVSINIVKREHKAVIKKMNQGF